MIAPESMESGNVVPFLETNTVCKQHIPENTKKSGGPRPSDPICRYGSHFPEVTNTPVTVVLDMLSEAIVRGPLYT